MCVCVCTKAISCVRVWYGDTTKKLNQFYCTFHNVMKGNVLFLTNVLIATNPSLDWTCLWHASNDIFTATKRQGVLASSDRQVYAFTINSRTFYTHEIVQSAETDNNCKVKGSHCIEISEAVNPKR